MHFSLNSIAILYVLLFSSCSSRKRQKKHIIRQRRTLASVGIAITDSNLRHDTLLKPVALFGCFFAHSRRRQTSALFMMESLALASDIADPETERDVTKNMTPRSSKQTQQIHLSTSFVIRLTSWQTHRQTCRSDPSSWCADHGPSGSSSGGDHGWHYTITPEGKNYRIFFRRLRSSRRLAWRLLDTICLNLPVSTSFCLLRNHWGMLY